MVRSRVLALILACAGLAGAGSALSQAKVSPDRARGFQAISQERLRHDLAWLSSDALQGRMTLQPGDAQAIAWVADEFAAAGLRPIGGGGGRAGYLQPVPITEFRPDVAGSTVTLLRGGRRTIWRDPQVSGSYQHAVDVTAPVVFAGYGITAPELGYDDYAGLDARGKIVLVFDHEPQENDPGSRFNGAGNTFHATTRVKLLDAQRHGALGLIVVAEPNRRHPTVWQMRRRIGSSLVRETPLPRQALTGDEVRIPSLTVTDEVARTLFATAGTGLAAAQAAIDRRLAPASRPLPDTILSIHLRNLSQRTGVSHNVAGLLPGSDPRLAAETVIISAHHDHDGMAACRDPARPPKEIPPDPHPCPQIWHGADDNGSGTVGVVELARAFHANGVRPRRSILFVVFTAEERGLLGSYWMAMHPLRPLAATRAVINFDMIGRNEAPSPQTDGLISVPADTANRLNLIGAPYSGDYARTVAQENTAVGLTLDDRFDRDNALNVLFRSDQFPFLLKGIPAFWWFTGFHPDYHHTTDTVEKINFPKMQKILRLAYLTAWRFADDPVPPSYTPAHAPVGGAAGKARAKPAPPRQM